MDWKEWILGKIADCVWNYFTGGNYSNITSDKQNKKFKEVIKNEENPNTILVKSQIRDFNSKSILFVMPGEEAVFINNGKIVKKFTEGRYVLTTSNYPFLSDLAVVVSGERFFSSNIYFIRTAVTKPLDWGTSIEVRDPQQLISTRVMCRGVYRLSITDSGLFVKYYMGNGSERLEQNEFAQILKDEILQKIKSQLAQFILERNQEIIGINRNQNELADKINKSLKDMYSDYGFNIVAFTISGIEILNNDRREKIEEAYSDKRIDEILKGRI